MIVAFCLMGGLGLVIGAGLAVASKLFYVYVDPKVLAVEDALPGANCGGCGYPGCAANAEAVVAGQSPPNSCVAAGPEVAEAIAAILGVTIDAREPDISRLGCTYGIQEAQLKYRYDGLSDCRAAALLSGGMKVCSIGCLGLGSCVAACTFDALSMGPDNLPVVDEARCTGCGACERACPKHIITLSSVTRRIIREYTLDDCTTPCQRACPAGIDIREYIRQITLGDYDRSLQIIKERNPFPTVIGRICPRPCENECRRMLSDEPVAINHLKRFVADREKASGVHVAPFRAPETGRRVAVVGGGVQGLSAAFFSARLGHAPTVFEAGDQPGGILRTAIAANRLPCEVLDWDIEGICQMGVQIETGCQVGRDATVSGLLRQGFEAVFLAAGGWDSRLARSGEQPEPPVLPGVHLLIDVLRAGEAEPLPEGSRVALVVDGLPGLDAARQCRRRGAEAVWLISRTDTSASGLSDETCRELSTQGIHLLFNAAVTDLYGEDDRLLAIACHGRDDAQPIRLPVDLLFMSAGRLPQLMVVPEGKGASEEASEESIDGRWHAMEAYKPPPERPEDFGFMSAGDAKTDFSAAIRAIAAGRRAAVSVHKVMLGVPLDPPPLVLRPGSYIQNVTHIDDVRPTTRQIMPLCTSADPQRCPELETGFSEAAARDEASRCLQCGLICYRDVAGAERKSESVN